MLKTISLLLILSFILPGCLSTNPPSRSETNPQPSEIIILKNPSHALCPPLAQTIQTKKNNVRATASGKHALLIGIENYNHPKITNLKGANNDVKLIQGVLRTRFGFQHDDFTILLDEQATHTCIENAFKELVGRVQSNDLVYIHYSGHGSQADDLNGDERSGLDQTWVSFGARQPERKNDKDNYDVLDDEINAWLAAIYAKTEQVIFVSDSCHSATVARGKVPVSRGLERDNRSHPLGGITYTKLKEYQGIHIGAARDQEFAAETLEDDNKFYGLFTWHWAKALQQAQVGETWDEVFKRAYTPIVEKRGQAQRPQLEGKRHRQVFGGHFTPPLATVSVSSVTSETIKIQAGAVAGVTAGSVYRQHQPRHPNPENLPRLEITQVEAFKSLGKITQGAFMPNDLVVEESHAYHFDPIKVYLSADYPKDEPLLRAIRAAFQDSSELPGYVLTNKPDKTELRLQLLRPKRGRDGQAIYEKHDDALVKTFQNQQHEFWILSADQHLLYKKLQIQFSDRSKGLELLKYNLNDLARVREIKALQSPYRGATKPVTVQTDILTPVKACPTGGNCMQLHYLGLYDNKGSFHFPKIGKHRLNKEDILTFTLHNKSRQDYYCYLINISPDGTIYVIYPNPEEGMEYARIKAGEKRELIDEVVLILENVGEQTLKLIATTSPIDVSLLQTDGFKGGNISDLNPLERLLVSAAHGQRGKIIRISNDEWVTEQVTFEVK